MPFAGRPATGLHGRLDGAIDVVDGQIEVDPGLDGLLLGNGLEVDAGITEFPELVLARQ